MADDWLYRQMKQCQKDVAEWPNWMKKAYGIKENDMQDLKQWECFCDEAYYHKWAVRDKMDKSFYSVVHVGTIEEAEFLVSALNEKEALEGRYNAQEKVIEQANLHLTAAVSGIIGYTSSLKEGDVVTKAYIERLESYYVKNLEQALTQLNAKEA